MTAIEHSNEPRIATIGMMDGVHLGHQHVLARLVALAQARGLRPMVVTFDNLPANVLRGTNIPLLSTPEQRKALIANLFGIHDVLIQHFDRDFARLIAEEYLAELRRRFNVRALLVGFDNRLGSDRRSHEQLKPIAASLGIEIIECDRLENPHHAEVKSTAIRALIAEGRVEEANDLLGHPFSIHGTVVEGQQIGRTIGFPTANVGLLSPELIVPCRGVYAVSVELEDLDRCLFGMCNIGTRPTITGCDAVPVTIEVNIFDFDRDIYGRAITVDFHRRLRGEQRFADIDSLKAQLNRDRDQATQFFNHHIDKL